MKTLLLTTLLVASLLCGCHLSPRSVAVKTLLSVGYTTDTAFGEYIDAAWSGRIPTNGVPAVGAAYARYKVAFRAAQALATSTNEIALDSVVEASGIVLKAVQSWKGVRP